MCKCTPGIKTPFCGKHGCEWPTVEVTIKPALTVERIREELADMVGLKLEAETNTEIVRRLNAIGLFDFSVKAKPTCTDERPCVNWEQYDRFMAHADDIIYDKTKNTLADWISDYGGRENEKGYVEFGSHYALAKMLDRRDKEVIRYVLAALVSETPQQAATPEADDLAQFLDQTDFDAAEKVASSTVDNQQALPAGEDDCEGCKI